MACKRPQTCRHSRKTKKTPAQVSPNHAPDACAPGGSTVAVTGDPPAGELPAGEPPARELPAGEPPAGAPPPGPSDASARLAA